jgi:hypothetical protein
MPVLTKSTPSKAWLSVYYMVRIDPSSMLLRPQLNGRPVSVPICQVLAWSVSSLNLKNVPSALQQYPPSAVGGLPKIWFDAAERALDAAGWAGKPQLRAVQAILLKISYQRPGSQSAGHGSEGTSFFVWLSAAIRICQCLGLHKLGNDATVMPVDDPALPSQACCLKRELAKRIWFFCVSHDWMFCTSASMNQIPLNSCKSTFSCHEKTHTDLTPSIS